VTKKIPEKESMDSFIDILYEKDRNDDDTRRGVKLATIAEEV